MANIGFHLGSETTELINPHMQREFPNDSTKYVTSTWERIKLLFDNIEVVKTFTKSNSYGVYVANGILYINGDPIAKDSNLIDSSEFGLRVDGTDVYFGKVKLTPTEGEVINITKEDYCTLLAGNVVDGYTIFNPENVYNIVENVANAPTITWNNPDNLKYVIYNNIVGIKDRQGNGIVHSFTDQHFLSTDTPQLSVHDYKFRILKGEHLKFMVMVDTKYLDKMLNNRLDDTFTIIVKNPYDKVLFCRTVYAGEIYVELSSFIDDNDELYSGETWFSVECIDNHGRGSAVRYYDLLILEDVPDNVYNVTTNDLETFGIQANNSNEMVAYNNKLGFTNLFKHFADLGYTKLVLPSNGVYYINYHALVDSTPNASKPFGECKFYIYNIHTTIYHLSELQSGDKIELIPGHSVIPKGGSPATAEVVGDPLEFVKQDKACLYRVTADDVATYGTNGIPIYHGDPNRILTNDDIGRIWVRWRNRFLYDDTVGGQTLWEITGENQEDELHLRLLNAYDPATMVYVGDSGKPFLRTYKEDTLPTVKDENKVSTYKIGMYYVIKNTAVPGDNIEFPDNITIDFNGSTLKAIHCQDSNGNDLHYFDLSKGRIIQLEENYNTHIKNLKVEGLFYEFDFARTALLTARSGSGVCEAVNNIDTAGSRFCSYENVESVYALCYDAKNLSKQAIRTAPNNAIPYRSDNTLCDGMFAQLGYIDFNGNVQNAAPIRSIINSDYGDAESLVLDETYRGCIVTQTCSRRKDSNGRPYSFRADDFTLLGGAYPNGNGKHYEMFVAFYNIPDSNIRDGVLRSTNGITFISIIKTRQMHRIKCPTGATHYRVVGYGLSKIENGVRISSMIDSYKYNKEFVVDGKTHTNAAFPCIDLHDWTYSEHSKCILYKNCYWHDTRSTAFSVETAKGVTFDNCTCNRVAYLPFGDWSITKVLSAFEDGGYKTSTVTIKNCTFIHTKADYQLTNTIHSPGNKLRYDEVNLLPLRCRDFTLVNNNGLSIATSAAVYDGYITDNEFEEFQVRRGQPIPYRHMVYRNNKVYRKFKKNYYSPESYYDPDTIDNDIDDDDSNDTTNNLLVNYSDPKNPEKDGYRQFNCDDAPSYKVVMQDQFTAEVVDNTHAKTDISYDYTYKRSKIGNKTYR